MKEKETPTVHSPPVQASVLCDLDLCALVWDREWESVPLRSYFSWTVAGGYVGSTSLS